MAFGSTLDPLLAPVRHQTIWNMFGDRRLIWIVVVFNLRGGVLERAERGERTSGHGASYALGPHRGTSGSTFLWAVDVALGATFQKEQARCHDQRGFPNRGALRIVAEYEIADRSGENVGRVEIGAAWSKRSNKGRDYLGLKLDDLSFNARSTPIVFDDEDGEGFSLIWSRPNGRRGD